MSNYHHPRRRLPLIDRNAEYAYIETALRTIVPSLGV